VRTKRRLVWCSKDHNIHYSIYFDFQKSIHDNEDDSYFVDGTLSHITVEKSKNTPKLDKIPVFIRDRKGGVIDSIEEILTISYTWGFIKQAGGWYSFSDEARKHATLPETKYRWSDLKTSPEAHEGMKKAITAVYRTRYMLVDEFYKELELLKAPKEKAA
jgi:hypothetical protein